MAQAPRSGSAQYSSDVRIGPECRVARTLASAFLVAFAVLAMHVLTAPTAVAGPDHESHATASTSGHVSDMLSVAASSGAPDGGHNGSGSHGGMSAMCLAVLGALVLVAIGLRLARSWMPARLLLKRLVMPRPRDSLGDPAPPDLHVLCIARC